MSKLRVVMTEVQAGHFARDIPIILRHTCGVEAERLIHTVPPEHAGNAASIQKMLIEAAQKSVEQADLVIIPGGLDINPAIYGQEKSRFTEDIPALCYRDEVEQVMINTAHELDIPIIYICRGYQLALALMSRDLNTQLIKFCQHLPEVTSANHRGDFFKEGKELIFNIQYILEDFIEDMKQEKKSPLCRENDLVHKVRIFPGTITHWLYRRALGLPFGYNEPIDVEETSHHHQGFLINNELQMPDNLVCSALSLAGDEIPVLEGFERTDKSMCVGFQFHLEANATGKIAPIFKDIMKYADFKKNNKSVSFLEWAEKVS